MANNNKTKRLDITLPTKTIELIDKQGFRSRSAFLDEAAKRYIARLRRSNIKRKLRAGYLSRAERDLDMVNEWEGASSGLLLGKTNRRDKK